MPQTQRPNRGTAILSHRWTVTAMLALLAWLSSAAVAETVRVGAAVSLKEALTAIARTYAEATGDRVELTFGSSGQLASQIRQGAPFDLFASASPQHVDDLAVAELILRDTRRVIVVNRLVLIVPGDAHEPPSSFETLVQPSVRRVAIGEPRTVPAGQYAQQVFEALGVAEQLSPKLVYGANVRQVLTYVERGEVSAGVVYATDARESAERVRVVATADTSTHDPIEYVAAVLTASERRSAAQRFLDYLLREPAARDAFTCRGFGLPPEPSTPPADR